MERNLKAKLNNNAGNLTCFTHYPIETKLYHLHLCIWQKVCIPGENLYLIK